MTNCGFDDMAYHYCPIDNSVYLGQARLWDMYSRLGDIAPAVALAHELGHRFQHVAGMGFEPQERSEIPLENQADCVSGAYMDYLLRNGNLSDDDVLDFAAGTIDAGSYESEGRTHGTNDQRLRAFYIGYNNGTLLSCVPYITNVALVLVADQDPTQTSSMQYGWPVWDNGRPRTRI